MAVGLATRVCLPTSWRGRGGGAGAAAAADAGGGGAAGGGAIPSLSASTTKEVADILAGEEGGTKPATGGRRELLALLVGGRVPKVHSIAGYSFNSTSRAQGTAAADAAAAAAAGGRVPLLRSSQHALGRGGAPTDAARFAVGVVATTTPGGGSRWAAARAGTARPR